MVRKFMSRLFIVDPVCAQVLGHNLTSLSKFRSYFSSFKSFDKIICLASKLLPASISEELSVKRCFSFYYMNRINVRDEDGNSFQDYRVGQTEYEELQFDIAEIDMIDFFEEEGVQSTDSLFFPSVDYYSCLALFAKLRRTSPQKSPNVFLRFIGVMEYACSLIPDPKRELLRQLSDLIKKGYPIRVSAESAAYAQHLAMLINREVSATPVPPFHDILPITDDGPFVVISPGSGRMDKGFGLLPEIVGNVWKSHPEANVRFIVQNLPSWDLAHNMHTAAQVYAGPGVEVLPPSIDFQGIVELFKQCHLVLMPYSPSIYEMRSSAILTEAVGYGRQLLTSKGTGFESEVAYFGLGHVCSSIEDYSELIFKLSKRPRSELHQTAVFARSRYTSYCLSQYKEWLK